MKYEIEVIGLPDGATTEDYICTKSNGDGSPDRARRVVTSRRLAEKIVRECREAKRRYPDNFEPDMSFELVRA